MPAAAYLRDMSLPELLAETVGDESVVAEVPLGGADRLAVTPTRTLVYRGDGLLSDETVAEYSHDVERIAVSTSRRKAKLTLGYGLDGDETLSVPAKRVDEILHPILAGVLSATGVTGPGESVLRTFRFSELTLVVTSDRVVKHVGSAVWDDEFEEFAYDDVTGLDFEEGTVATAVVLVHDGRSERFKAPNESARAVRETLVDAVCAFHDVDSLEEFRVTVAADEEDAADADATGGGGSTTDFGEGPDPLSASPVADAEAEAEAALGADAPADVDADAEAETAPDADALSTADVDQPADVGPTTDARTDEQPPDPTGEGPGADASDPLSAGVGDAEGETDVSVGTEPAADQPAEADAVASDTATPEDAATDTDAAASRSETDPAADPSADLAGEADPIDEAFDATDVGLTDDSTEGQPTDADAFDGSPFESAGVEGEDLATEVVALRRTVEAQSERLDRQSALIEQLIEELRRGR